MNAGEKSCIISDEISFKNVSVFYPERDGKFELCGMLLVNHATSVIDQKHTAKLNSLLGGLCALSESASGRFNVLFIGTTNS